MDPRRTAPDPGPARGAIRRLADRFASSAEACGSRAALKELIEETVSELGFRFYALLHHASMRQGGAKLLRLDNYPAAWADHFARGELWRSDPVQLASRHVNTGFAWDEIGRIIHVTAEHKRILTAGRRFGVGHGFTVPANIPGEPAASCSFAVAAGSGRLPEQRLKCAELVGAHAFRALRRIERFGAGKPPRLSRRELQSVRLVAAGKTDWEIAAILGISRETARQYVKKARAAYDVVSRTQLVSLGLRDRWLELEDIGLW